MSELARDIEIARLRLKNAKLLAAGRLLSDAAHRALFDHHACEGDDGWSGELDAALSDWDDAEHYGRAVA